MGGCNELWCLAWFQKDKTTNVDSFVFSMPTHFTGHSWVLLLSISSLHVVYKCLIALMCQGLVIQYRGNGRYVSSLSFQTSPSYQFCNTC